MSNNKKKNNICVNNNYYFKWPDSKETLGQITHVILHLDQTLAILDYQTQLMSPTGAFFDGPLPIKGMQ